MSSFGQADEGEMATETYNARGLPSFPGPGALCGNIRSKEGTSIMKKSVLALAALTAFGFSGVAYAGEATRGPTTMTDAEMDKVTAGDAYVNVYNPGEVDVRIYTNGQGPNPSGDPSGLTVYPGYPHTSSRVCVNSCSF
jgi:hypothetical protein